MEAENRNSGYQHTVDRWAIIATGLAVTVLLSCGRGSGGDSPDPSTVATLRLNTLQSCDAYQTYVADALVEQFRPRNGSSWAQPASDGTAGTEGQQPPPSQPSSAPGSATGGAAGDASTAPSHVTGTNNQEPGVDEPDIVKTDSNGVLYIAHGDHLRIVAGHPPKDLKELAALDAGGAVYDLFLDEATHRAVLFAAHVDQMIPASPPSATDTITMPAFYQRMNYVVSFVDVSDPSQPVLTARWTLNGYPLDARRIADRVHFVLSNPIDLPPTLANDTAFWKLYVDYYNAPTADAASAIEQQIVAAIRNAVAAMDVTQLLPTVSIERDGQTTPAPIVGCGDISAPKVLTRPSLLTVASFDTDGANLSASAITAYGAAVYASPKHLYVTQYSGGWFGNDELKPETAIHQFSVSGAAPRYEATGVVAGWVRNAFALSEYDGNLRVATNVTTWSKGVTTQSNNLFVLHDNGNGELTERGSVREFGQGEMMYSARFLGARGFVVTYRRVDPLFAFDLSDPDHPSLAGELTIPGFSEYMHPLGDNYLLTIGRNDGWSTQLQIFDISNLAKPVQLRAYTPTLPGSGYSYSNAEYDHHAFTFDDVNNVLAIPLSYWNYNSGAEFNGIVAFKVDTAAGFEEIVRVDHADLANAALCGGGVSTTANTCHYGYAAYPRRSVIMTADMGVTLYSVSDAGIKATNLAPPHDTLGSIVFPVEPPPPIYGYPPVAAAKPTAASP